jgi:hypothetical protein
MHLFGHHHYKCDNPLDGARAIEVEIYHMLAHIIEQQKENAMATQAQIDKLKTDVAALITAGVAEINAAIAAAQTASPDPAIDQLDSDVTAATKGLTDAAAKLTAPTP